MRQVSFKTAAAVVSERASWWDHSRQMVSSSGFLLFVAVMLFGISWPLVKLAVVAANASAFWLAASRSGFASVVLFVLLAVMGRLRCPGRVDLPALLVTGILQLSAFFLLCHIAVRSVPAGHTSILSNAAVIFVVPLSVLLRQKEPTSRWAAALTALLGVGVLLGPWSVDWTDWAELRGYGALLLAAFAWACTIVTMRIRPPRLSAFALLPWAFALSFGLLTGLAWMYEPDAGLPRAVWPAALFNGGLVAPLGTYCLFELSRRLSPMRSSVCFMAIPVAGVLVSAALLGEPVSLQLVGGTAVILAGAMLAGARWREG